MIKIKGERYYNDYTRSNIEKTFSTLEDVFDWGKEISCNFTARYGNYFPSIKRNENGDIIDIGRISFDDYNSRGYQCWIYEISNENGIIFSTGRTTSGKEFCAKKVEEWLKSCDQKIKEIKNKPNFVEM